MMLRCFRHGEAVLFWAVVTAHLIPIWAFPYLPTQDGPAHLGNAIVLKDYGSPGTRYHEFFERRFDPIPNWTSHLLLVGLLFVVPPLIAEKILVSAYVVALAGSLRYFCGSFGPRTRPLALVGLLFAFNRCIWLGFYNFGLSLALCWFLLGYWVRRRQDADIGTAAALSLLLAATFFTHLVGFLLAAVALAWFAVTSPRHRWRNLGWVILASAPAGLLGMEYFDRTGFFNAGGADRLIDHPWKWLQGPLSADFFGQFPSLDNELFAHHSGDVVPMGLLVLLLYGMLALVTLLPDNAPTDGETIPPSRWPVAVLALGFAILFVLLPEHLSMEHGGFLRTRMALVPPLLLLASFREPTVPAGVWVLRTTVLLVLAVNLILVTQRVKSDNQVIAEFTAGREAVGRGRILFVVQSLQHHGRNPKRDFANPLLHASHYYCLGTDNLNLDNYEATTRHFPLRFRDGVTRGRGSFANYARQKEVDVILAWQTGPNPGIPNTYRLVFHQGRMAVFVRKQ